MNLGYQVFKFDIHQNHLRCSPPDNAIQWVGDGGPQVLYNSHLMLLMLHMLWESLF